MTARPDPRVGSELGPYRIEAVLGRGGMGVVYLATHAGLDRRVALKLLAPDYADDEAFRARFLRESRMAAAIDHPNIIPIYEAGEVDGAYFLAMRYVAGTDLETRLRAGPLEPREAVLMLGQVASALDAAHEAGLVHRDVKPANVLLASGKGVDRADHAYLTDFGLTKHRGSETGLTRGGAFLGTLDYIAPEQVEGKPVDGRADQYALACLAFHGLSGRVPFARDTEVAIAMAHLRDAPPSLVELRPELPAAVDTVLARGMAKRPDDRFPSCETFAGALREALGVRPTEERRAVAGGSRRTRRIAVGAAAVLLVAVLAVTLAAWRLEGGAGPSPSAVPASPGGSVAASSTAPSAAASGAGDAFPNAAEQRLAASLPEALRATCRRGPYTVVDGYSGASTPTASLLCNPDVSTGAGEVRVWQFRPETAKLGIVTGVISRLADSVPPVPPGDCATSRRANGRWTVAGVDRGAIICFVDGATGDALLYWGYDADAVLVGARNPRGDSRALHAFFEDYARFFSP